MLSARLREWCTRIVILISILFTASFISSQAEEPVRVYGEQQDDFRILFYADNDLFIPAFISVDFPSLTNLIPDTPMPFRLGLDPESERTYLFALDPGEGRRLRYRVSYSYSRGNPFEADPDEDYLYLFPFAHGTKQRLTQGFNGRFTHFAENQFALDFDLGIGDEVFAARGGIVVEIKEDSNVGGPSAQYGPFANFVLVMHEDGTFGNYVHLQQNGALVEAGDEIEAGQLIGLSGNTGRSSGPHLHFDVRIPLEDGRMQSIPIRFRGTEDEAVDPIENSIYYASHPGLPEFEVVFGDAFANQDFVDYSGRTNAVDNIDFRVEQTDLTYVVYIGNGFDYPIDAEVRLNLQSMTSTTGSPVQVSLEAGEERFLTILRPVDGASSWRYSYSASFRRTN